ncbi:MAG TPA: SAM-dependent methyltransferase [Armatimonadota bacterium]|jgi:SAM-dependent MidA family methyltransferase
MDQLHAEVTRSIQLLDEIRAEIARCGPMRFSRFMDLALYHSSLGYYRTHPGATTRAGDFLTAPETHPAFGALLARFALACRRALGDSAFAVVEQGSGTGSLAEAFTGYWRASRPRDPLRYVVVEPDADARRRLSARLGSAVEAVETLGDAGPVEGLFLSNELLDAFPVDRIRRRNGELVSVDVDAAGDRLVECERPAPEDDSRWLEASGIDLIEGNEIEVCPGLEGWVRSVSGALTRGYVLTIDYGYEAGDVPRMPRGTMLAHYRHGLSEEFLQRVGLQDLTAHVCWDAVERLGAAAGLMMMERQSQRTFLARWGWKEFALWKLALPDAASDEMDAIDRLGRADALGGLDVMLQAVGDAPAPNPADAGAPAWDAIAPFGF